jgi:prefoldin subunit 5
MESMDYKALNQLEQELLAVLKDEYSFYQSLYIMLDKQRDQIKFDKDDRLMDLFAEIQRFHARIKTSDDKIALLGARNSKIFDMAVALPEVKKLTNSIATLIKRSIGIITECEEYIQSRHERIREELDKLRNSHKIIKYIADADTSPHFVDGKN